MAVNSGSSSEFPSLSLFGSPVLRFGSKPVEGLRAKSMAILAYLAVENRPVGRDTLAAMFWPESGQSQARGNLRTSMHNLSSILGSEVILSGRERVEIRTSGLGVDVLRFRSLVRDYRKPARGGKSAADGGNDIVQAVQDIFSSAFMAGFTLPDSRDFDDWQYHQGVSLQDDLASLLSRAADHMQRTGQTERAIRMLRHLSAMDPLNEEARLKTIRLLAAAGDRSGAAREYGSLVEMLDKELDAEPDMELEEILAQGEDLAAETRSWTAPPPPRPTRRLIGRGNDLAVISGHLADGCRIVTLTGSPGAGKTTVAVELANQLRSGFESGSLFIDLNHHRDCGSLYSAILTAIGIGMHNTGFGDERSDGGILGRWLQDRNLLIILDNFEHMLPCVNELAQLVELCAETRFLLTSREALRIPQEHVHEILPLPVPRKDDPDARRFGAVELFLERASRLFPELTVDDEEMKAIVRICRRLDGLPLGIELAVPKISILGISGLETALMNLMTVLSDGPRDLPERHRNLEQAMEGSWNSLSEDGRRLLSAMSVLTGEFAVDAVRAMSPIMSDPERHLAVLSRLTEMHLVRTLSFGSERRFRLLETVREYAGRKGGELAILDDSEELLIDFHLDLVKRTAPLMVGPAQKSARESLNRSMGNIVRVLDCLLSRGRYDEAAELAADLSWFWHRNGHGVLAINRYRVLYESGKVGEKRILGRLCHAYGLHLFVSGRWEQAKMLYEKALTLARDSGDLRTESLALSDLETVQRWSHPVPGEGGNPGFADRALDIARQLDDPMLVLRALTWRYATTGGHFPDGTDPLPHLREIQALSERIGDEWFWAHAMNGIGDYLAVQGHPEESREAYRSALGAFASQEDRWMLAWTHDGLASVADGGDSAGVISHLFHALDLFDTVGDEFHTCQTAWKLVKTLDGDGHIGEAVRFLAASRRVMDVSPDQDDAAAMESLAREYRSAFHREWVEGMTLGLRKLIPRYRAGMTVL